MWPLVAAAVAVAVAVAAAVVIAVAVAAAAAFVAMKLLHATLTVLINYEYLCAVRSRDGRATHKVIKLAQNLCVSRCIRRRLVNNVCACPSRCECVRAY